MAAIHRALRAFTRNRSLGRAVLHAVEGLESRRLLTTTVFIDYGDNFGGNVLNTTVGALDSTVSGANPNIDGPAMLQAGGTPYAAGTALAITSLAGLYAGAQLTNLKTQMTSLATRFFEGLDITVVELTSNFQNVNGTMVRAAASLTEISQTLGANEGAAENNDAYIIVGRFVVNGVFNPANGSYGGLATGTDIGGPNNNDGTAVVCLLGAGDGSQFNGNQIAHEAGHVLGLRHVYRQNTGSPPPALINTTATGAQYDMVHQSEMMSYLGYTSQGGYNFFSRYPMMRGDGNTNANTLSSIPSPFEAMANDVNIGAGAVTKVTGTGAHDRITITRTGAGTASVTVEAFGDSARTVTIDAPGATGNVYSYNIVTTQPIIVDGGGRDDLIRIVGNLNTGVTVRGMHGVDQLEVDAQGAATATYTPNNLIAAGLDGNSDRRGTITFAGTVVNYQEFEATGSVRIVNATNLTFTTPAATDSVTMSNVAGDAHIAGASNSIALIPFRFAGVTNFVLDAFLNGTAPTSDTITVAPGGVIGLATALIKSGNGNDTLSYSGAAVVAAFTFESNLGNDNLTMTNVNSAGPVFNPGGGTLNTATVQSGAWTVVADMGASSQVIDVSVSAGASATFLGTRHHLNVLSIAGAGTATMGASGTRTLVTKVLTINAGGNLDLQDNDMIVDYTGASVQPAIQNLINAARSGGTWIGNGITSTAAKNAIPPTKTLGVLEGTEYSGMNGGSLVFNGEPIDATAVLVKYTYYGDTDFNGTVNFDDYSRLDGGFLNNRSGWMNGDVNGDGTVNFDDYALVDQAFLTQGGVILKPARAPGPPPKPAILLAERDH